MSHVFQTRFRDPQNYNNMEKFGKLMAILLVMVLLPIMNGFVFSKLWGWFIVPTFNMAPIRIVEAIGIIFIIGFVTAKYQKQSEENFWSEFAIRISFVVSLAFATLFMGWVLNHFM